MSREVITVPGSNMAFREGQIIICKKCGGPTEGGVIQSDGTIRFVRTRNFGR